MILLECRIFPLFICLFLGIRSQIRFTPIFATSRQALSTSAQPCNLVGEADSTESILIHLLAETNPLGGKRTKVYDKDGRLVEESDWLGAATKYTYSPIGFIENVAGPLGNTTKQSNDALGMSRDTLPTTRTG